MPRIIADALRVKSPAWEQLWPKDIRAFIDTIALWLNKPLARDHYKDLANACGSLVPEHPQPGPKQGFIYRLALHQPSALAFHLLDGHEVYVTGVHSALDLLFSSWAEASHADAYLNAHLVKRWRRGEVHVRHVGGTRYSDRRGARNGAVVYADQLDRHTLTDPCCHIEWRSRFRDNLVDLGLATLSEIERLDLHDFWSRRLLLREIDPQRLGEVASPYRKGSREALQHGHLLAEAYSWNVQNIVDAFKGKVRPKAYLRPLDATHFLPPRVRYPAER